jgi:hypothetical protein
MWVTDYKSVLCNIPEEQRPCLRSSGGLGSWSKELIGYSLSPQFLSSLAGSSRSHQPTIRQATYLYFLQRTRCKHHQYALCIAGASPGRPDAKAVKENQIPNELLQTIDTFK